jgi:hypothetical protein
VVGKLIEMRDTRKGVSEWGAHPKHVHEFAIRQNPGFGDKVREFTKKLGVKECQPCLKRQALLNSLFPFK